jgi:hypothetical protein
VLELAPTVKANQDAFEDTAGQASWRTYSIIEPYARQAAGLVAEIESVVPTSLWRAPSADADAALSQVETFAKAMASWVTAWPTAATDLASLDTRWKADRATVLPKMPALVPRLTRLLAGTVPFEGAGPGAEARRFVQIVGLASLVVTYAPLHSAGNHGDAGLFGLFAAALIFSGIGSLILGFGEHIRGTETRNRFDFTTVPDRRACYFLRVATRSDSVQCWTTPVTSPFASFTSTCMKE